MNIFMEFILAFSMIFVIAFLTFKQIPEEKQKTVIFVGVFTTTILQGMYLFIN